MANLPSDNLDDDAADHIANLLYVVGEHMMRVGMPESLIAACQNDISKAYTEAQEALDAWTRVATPIAVVNREVNAEYLRAVA